MTVTDDLLASNERFNGPLPLPPAKHLAVLACIPHVDSVRGFVFDVANGRLREVS